MGRHIRVSSDFHWECADQEKFLVTYIVIHPLEMSVDQLEEAAGIMKVGFPADKIGRLEQLRRDDRPQSHVHVFYAFHINDIEKLRIRTKNRGDDLIYAGTVNPLTDLRE